MFFYKNIINNIYINIAIKINYNKNIILIINSKAIKSLNYLIIIIIFIIIKVYFLNYYINYYYYFI